MAASGKTLQQMRSNSSGWRIEDLLESPRKTESSGADRAEAEVTWYSALPLFREIVSVPAKRPIKPVYIKHFLALIDAARKFEKP